MLRLLCNLGGNAELVMHWPLYNNVFLDICCNCSYYVATLFLLYTLNYSLWLLILDNACMEYYSINLYRLKNRKNGEICHSIFNKVQLNISSRKSEIRFQSWYNVNNLFKNTYSFPLSRLKKLMVKSTYFKKSSSLYQN